MNPHLSCFRPYAAQEWVCPGGLPTRGAWGWGALMMSWPSWRHSLGDEIVDSWCPRATLGDSGSLAKLGEAGPGLAPWEVTVGTVHASSALHPGRWVCVVGIACPSPTWFWNIRAVLSCFRALNKAECCSHPPPKKQNNPKLKQTASITSVG